MNGRGFKLLALLAILALALSVTGAALAAPAADQPEILKIDVCHATASQTNPYVLINVNINSVEDAENVGGHGNHEGDSWEPYTYEGVDYPGQGDMSNCAEQPPYETCSQVVAGTPGEWSTWTIDPEDSSRYISTRTVPYYDSVDTQHLCSEVIEPRYMDRPVCQWNPQLWADDPACQPPPGEASGSFTPYCGGGINVVLANARLWIDDFDPFTEGGSYPLNVGDHSFVWEALEGFVFPEGLVTEGRFAIDSCPLPEEPSTGPEGALPIAEGIAFLAFSGLGWLGIRRLTKK